MATAERTGRAWWGGAEGALRFALEMPRRTATLPAIMQPVAPAAPPVPHTTLEKLQQVPSHIWWMIALGILGFILVVLLIRHAAQINKFVLAAIIFMLVFVVGMQWVYERNEPEWATPVVEWLANFLPSKGKLGTQPKPGQPPAPKPAAK